MNPTKQEPAYEYCLGSEALQKWGPKTEGMHYCFDDGEAEKTWYPVLNSCGYKAELTYRRKRQTPVQDGEEWKPLTDGQHTGFDKWPIYYFHEGKVGVARWHAEIPFGSSHWKNFVMPAPPKPKQKTQEEIDNEAIDEMVKSTEFSSREPNLIFWFRQGAQSALAWERSRGKEDGK